MKSAPKKFSPLRFPPLRSNRFPRSLVLPHAPLIPPGRAAGFIGAVGLIRELGRIGSAGQTRSVSFPSPDEAEVALHRQYGVRERRGYDTRQNLTEMFLCREQRLPD
jgi:predicted DNA-binding WGR domain protein